MAQFQYESKVNLKSGQVNAMWISGMNALQCELLASITKSVKTNQKKATKCSYYTL